MASPATQIAVIFSDEIVDDPHGKDEKHGRKQFVNQRKLVSDFLIQAGAEKEERQDIPAKDGDAAYARDGLAVLLPSLVGSVDDAVRREDVPANRGKD